MFPFIVNNSMYMCQIIVDKSMYVNVPIDCQLIYIHKYNVSIYCQQIYVHKCVDLFATNLCTCDDLLFANVHKCVDLFSTNLCTCDNLLFAIQFDL